MGSVTLSDIGVTPLQRIAVIGGDVLHALKSTDSDFHGFGEAYFSTIATGAIKGWKRHGRMTMNLIVPVGMVKFVFYQEGGSLFREETIGIERYVRLTVPAGIWFGFQGIAGGESMVLNIASIPHDPDEVERLPITAIAYQWNNI
ncbi:dTDP-4-dehydrorhamnose 3,5-epimerase [Chlorobium phaeovibrioides]|uniref:dTDP-4-dehydrorhamnose 3,5-epimerase n=1 Tax=Chlorobium phaeovibrioides TaxID=1094 RepID=A0A3S0N950_CHLPH|nr:dTDP-4-dehydrorhamnose 3,5-epimerase [Chlorobium phaeovibrioides]RTY34919.1 dTDP-4-dehydrorhamnose 3,5-epimerase [Chlorobium phaeovibrioides]